MSDLKTLYHEMIIDHSRHPRNFGILETANHTKEGFNPLCGDRVTIYVREENGVIEDLRFDGVGCAISIATASLMTEALKGKTLGVAEEFYQAFHEVLTRKSQDFILLGKLSVLAGVSAFPMRVKCATLVWHTFQAAINNNPKPVSTE